jgi:parvulin-like peptidyl-prolyl isomerase
LWDSKSNYSGEGYLKEKLEIAQGMEYSVLNNILVKLSSKVKDEENK